MFISELIAGKFYYVAEGRTAHALRWSIVPHRSEPITRVQRFYVPARIRAQCQELLDADCKRRYRERVADTLCRAAASDIRVPGPVTRPARGAQLHRPPVSDRSALRSATV